MAEEICKAVTARLGLLPNFFRPHPGASAQAAALWKFAESAYLDNPLPSLFKERLFVYLSRFCSARYCVARHAGYLLGLGHPSGDPDAPVQSLDEVLQLLRRPLLRGEILNLSLRQLKKSGRLAAIPLPGSELEEGLIGCASHLFLQTGDAPRCREALEKTLSPEHYENLLLFMTYVRAAHFHAAIRPTTIEPDVELFLSTEEELARRLLATSEPAGDGLPAYPEAKENSSEYLGRQVTELLWENENIAGSRRVALNLLEDAVDARERAERAQAAHAESEQKFRSLVEAHAQAVWDTTPTGEIVEDNPSWRAFTGQTFEEMMGFGWVNAVHPEDRAIAERRWREAVATGGTLDSEYRLRYAPGGYRWTKALGAPIIGPDGSVIKWSGMNIDIHDRKEFEEALRQSEAHLKAVFAKVAVGISEFSAEGKFLRGNETICRMLGRDHSELLEKNVADVTHPEDVETTRQAFAELLRTGESLTLDKRYLRPDGTIIWVNSALSLVTRDQDAPPIILTVTADLTHRREAERAMRESELRYRTLFESIDEGFCLIEVLFEDRKPTDYRFLEANPAFEAQTGLRDVVGKTMRELAPCHEDHWFDIYGNIALTGEPQRFNQPAEALGKYYDVYAFRVGEPEQRRVAILFNDISERKKAEDAMAADLRDTQALRELAVRFATPAEAKTLYEEINDVAIRLAQAQGGTVQIYDEATESLRMLAARGFPVDGEARFKTVEAGSGTSCGLALAAGEQVIVDFDAPGMEDPKGDLAWLVNAGYRTAQSTPLISRSGKPIGMLSTHWREHYRPTERELRYLDLVARQAADLIEQRTAEKRLSESEERLRLIVENARDYAIVSMDLERKVRSWNTGAEALLGYAQREILGKSADIIFSSEDRRLRAPEIEAETAIAHGRASDERWHIRKNGTPFWGSGVMMAMHDAGGRTVGLVKIFRDVTETRAAQKALEQSKAELMEALRENEAARAEVEAASRAKDHFLAVLSHELRTPLTPVLMTTMTLQRRVDLAQPVIKGLEMIRRNVKLECHLIDDLLDLTRIARGRLDIVRERFDLHNAVRGAVEVTQPDIEQRNQHLSVAFKAGRSDVIGDATRLQQLIWNLLKNASKFTPDGGRISLETQNMGDKIAVRVTDTGAGIRPEKLSIIFNAFTQAEDSTFTEYGGLGLGLAIAKATVEAHGGNIEATSDGPGHGSTFFFELPLAAETAGGLMLTAGPKNRKG